MKIVKDYQSRNMKHIQYDCNDAELLKKRFTELKSKTIDKLCKWLKDNNDIIDADDCYDSQSGWQGTNFKIGNADLSLNGYCLTDENVLLFLSGNKDKRWYNFYDKEYKEIELNQTL